METKTLIKKLLENFGEDPEREGLKETPCRVQKMYEEILSGYNQEPKDIFKFFDSEQYEGTVELKEIPFFSLCEHHLLPFWGTIDILYRPNGHIVGISKLARLVEIYSRRLQIQERLTRQIAEAVMENLCPKGCVVIVRAEHLCMSMRGVKRPGMITETKCIKGEVNF